MWIGLFSVSLGLMCAPIARWKQAQWSWWCAILLGFSKRWRPALKNNGPPGSDWVPPSTTASSCAKLSRSLWDIVEQSFQNGSMFAVIFVSSLWQNPFLPELKIFVGVCLLWMRGMPRFFVLFCFVLKLFYFCSRNWGRSSVVLCKVLCHTWPVDLLFT